MVSERFGQNQENLIVEKFSPNNVSYEELLKNSSFGKESAELRSALNDLQSNLTLFFSDSEHRSIEFLGMSGDSRSAFLTLLIDSGSAEFSGEARTLMQHHRSGAFSIADAKLMTDLVRRATMQSPDLMVALARNLKATDIPVPSLEADLAKVDKAATGVLLHGGRGNLPPEKRFDFDGSVSRLIDYSEGSKSESSGVGGFARRHDIVQNEVFERGAEKKSTIAQLTETLALIGEERIKQHEFELKAQRENQESEEFRRRGQILTVLKESPSQINLERELSPSDAPSRVSSNGQQDYLGTFEREAKRLTAELRYLETSKN